MKQMLGVACAMVFWVGCGSSQSKPEEVSSTANTGSESASNPSEATSSNTADGAVQTWKVASELVDCEGEGPMKCLRIKRAADGEWELFYSNIEGFEHVAGKEYELKVEVSNAGDAMADRPNQRYKLVEIVRAD